MSICFILNEYFLIIIVIIMLIYLFIKTTLSNSFHLPLKFDDQYKWFQYVYINVIIWCTKNYNLDLLCTKKN